MRGEERSEKVRKQRKLRAKNASFLFPSPPLACEQALSGTLAKGREKEGELATTSLEFEHLHRKSRYEMLIGGNDIANDVICLGTF